MSMLLTIAVWIWDQSMVLLESLRDSMVVVPSAGQKVTQDREVSPVISQPPSNLRHRVEAECGKQQGRPAPVAPT